MHTGFETVDRPDNLLYPDWSLNMAEDAFYWLIYLVSKAGAAGAPIPHN